MHNNAQSRVSTLSRILDYINRAIDKLEQDPNLSSPSHEQSFEATGSNETVNGASGRNFSSGLLQPASSITEIGIVALSDNQPDGDLNLLEQLNMDLPDSLFSSTGENNVVINLSNLGNPTADQSSTTTTTNSTSASATNQTPNINVGATAQQPTQTSMLNNLIGSLTRGIIGQSIGQTLNIPFSSINIQPNSTNNSTASERNRTGSGSSSATANNSDAATNNQQSQQNTTQQTNRNSRLTWTEYAEILNNVKQTQERFNPHFASFQQSLLQRHGSLSQQEAEEEQAKYRLVARCLHHLAHVYHLLSDFYVNYTHQQDEHVQVFEQLNVSPFLRRGASPMSNRTLILGSGFLNDLGTPNVNPSGTANPTAGTANVNPQRSTTSEQQPQTNSATTSIILGPAILNNLGNSNANQPQTNSTTSSTIASSLPSSFMFVPNVNQTESPNNNGSNTTSTTTTNNSRRTLSSLFAPSPSATTQNNNNNGNTNRSSSSETRNRSIEQGILQSLFGTSLPNLSGSNVQIISGQPRPVNSTSISNNIPGATSISIIQTIGMAPSRVGSSQPQTDQTSQSNNQQQQPPPQQTTNTNSQQPIAANLQNLFNFGTSAGSARSNAQQGVFSNNNVYRHVRNFDPHLPCTSNWLIPEVRGRLEVEMNMNIDAVDLAALGRFGSNNQNVFNNNTDSNHLSNNTSARRNLDLRTQQPSASSDLDALELFNEIKKLFSSYLERDELLRRIDSLPRCADNSLSSFIDSMNILNLVSKNKSNITLELFMILAQKISVTEFLKIILMKDFTCLNRAQDLMVSYARTNLLFSTEEPFDTSSCVDDLLKMWKKVLLSSFNELEFSERTFSALMSELRANLSVFLRTFTLTFNNSVLNSSFAYTIYIAIRRLFLDFHTSLSQMFRSPNNVMRAYKNILVST